MTCAFTMAPVGIAGSAAAYFLPSGLPESGPRDAGVGHLRPLLPERSTPWTRSATGGHGLLWNPSSDCGQPFFGNVEAGLLYPANVFFLMLDPGCGPAGRALFFNLMVAGLSAFYLLCTELGLSPGGRGRAERSPSSSATRRRS